MKFKNIFGRKFSSTFKGKTSYSKSSNHQQQYGWFWYYCHTIRAFHIIGTAVSIFSVGYCFGLAKYAPNPKVMDDKLLNEVLRLIDADIDLTDAYHNQETPEYRRVQKISVRIIDAAKMLCLTKISLLQEEIDLKNKTLEFEREKGARKATFSSLAGIVSLFMSLFIIDHFTFYN